jgi:hypothetical protein
VWMLVQPAAAQTRNEYRDVLSAAFDYAVRKRWLDVNPLAEVKRASKREERERILRREDFYDTDEPGRQGRRREDDSGAHAAQAHEHDRTVHGLRPRPELANQITRALDPDSLPENVIPIRPAPIDGTAAFFERLEEEIPAKWLREIQRLAAETGARVTA